MTTRFYAGHLIYADGSGDFITIHRLALHDDNITFELLTTWDGGDWSLQGHAERLSGSTFRTSRPLRATAVAAKEVGPMCALQFVITPSEDGGSIQVEGRWDEDGDTYPFGGELEERE